MPTLNWIGKKEIKHHFNNIEYRVLDCKETIGECDNGNLLIKGDNLLALKALLPYYAGKVKAIYIDPPYNTGSTSWVYNDAVDSPIIKKWLKKTVDKEDLSRSDKWLCMIYPRIKLLHKFLKEEGVIFVSIDDAEVASLRLIMDDIFGKQNFISIIQWKRSESQNNNAKHVSKVGEFILCYSKGDKQKIDFNAIDLNQKALKEYRYEDEQGRFRRGTIVDKTRGKNIYKVVAPTGVEVELLSIRTKEWFEEMDSKGLIYWTKTNTPYGKIYLENNEGQKSSNWFDNAGFNEDATEELNNIGIHFPFSKPYSLIQRLIKLVTNPEDNDIILDSFAGSGTTAQAVLEQNKTDNGNRKFILIQMEEEIPEDSPAKEMGFNYVHEITKTRVKKVIEGYEYKGNVRKQLIEPLKLTPKKILDPKFMANIHSEVNKLIEINKDRFDKIDPQFKDNSLFVSGIKKVTQKVEGLGSGFQYCELSEPLLDEFGLLSECVTHEMLAKHIYFTEFGVALSQNSYIKDCNYIGKFDNKELHIYLDKNFNIQELQKIVKEEVEEYIIYADTWSISNELLKQFNITIKKIPTEIKGA
ncbi:site-specific DNA-methyltransferase [Aliarcobacter butzleri]|uniref:site-specific DNA-methyltransferase n=1 Tax=Aliarcobacter butzleri TaxID=28197 RepID=UPI00344B64C9